MGNERHDGRRGRQQIAVKEPQRFAPYEVNDPFGIRLKREAVSVGGTRLLIPVLYLQGTQLAGGYTTSKAKRVEASLKEGGAAFLEQYPIITTAIFYADGDVSIYVEDGHHRGCKAPKFGITSVHCIVLTVEQMSEVRKRLDRLPNSPEGITRTLEREATEAQESFALKGIAQTAENVPHVTTMQELILQFPSF
jgi:hypothetical protein